MATNNHPISKQGCNWKDAAIVALVVLTWVAVSGVALIPN